MPAATVPMPVVIGKEAQELRPSTSSHGGLFRCAITNGAAMPSHMATDPLGMEALVTLLQFAYHQAGVLKGPKVSTCWVAARSTATSAPRSSRVSAGTSP